MRPDRFFDLVLTRFDNDPASLEAAVYVWFNRAEAVLWFGLASYVWWRHARLRGTRIELVYGLFVFLFGLSDLVECYRLTVGLLAAKGIILLAILVCRHVVVRAYPERRFRL